MKAQLYTRPQSRRIKVESASGNRRSANKDKAEEYFKKGKVEQINHKYEKAIEFYMRSIGYNPNYFQSFCNMGYCYRALGKYVQAKRCYFNSLSINREDPISHYNLANLYRIIGENELAIQQYSFLIDLAQEQKISIGNLHINSLINVGICYKNEGLVQEAIRVYRKVIEIDPYEQDAEFNLAICLLNSIEDKNSFAFNKFYHEKAMESEALFRKIAQKNQKNYMAKLSLIKISAFLKNDSKNIEKCLVNLKEMLLIPQCDIKDEVSQEIARCLHLLKKYQESSKFYEGSIGNLTRKKQIQAKKHFEEVQKIDNIFEQFRHEQVPQGYSYPDDAMLTESVGIKLIQDGEFAKITQMLQKLEDNILKHTLELILHLKQGETDEQYLVKAIKIYQTQFQQSETEMPFEKLSLQAHKAIGKVLSLMGRFEDSIKHYEFISTNLKANRQSASAKLYTQLGEGFQETGNIPKALEQYKRAIEIQPNNYTLTYNMGYCLYQSGNHKEAADYFQNILQKIKGDSKFSSETKQLYETDCMIILAVSNQDDSKRFQLFSAAFAKLQELKKHQQNDLQLLQENLLIFLIQASQLYEQKLNLLTSTDPQFISVAEVLLEIYSSLLDLNNCPDVDQILINCGNIYYQLRRYLSSVQSYEQVSKVHLVPQINQALAYAHLVEPVIATKHIQHACKKEPKDLTNRFCQQVIEWIYYKESNGQWNRFLPIVKWDMFYERQEYGMAIIDKLTEIVNQPSFQSTTLPSLLPNLVKNSASLKFKQFSRNVKFQKIKGLIEKYDLVSDPSVQKNILSPSILKICFTKSHNIRQDFKKLIALLSNIPQCGRESEFCQAAIYIFIYYNQGDSQKIRQFMQQLTATKKQVTKLKTSNSIKENEDLYSIYPDFKSVKEFVLTLKQWQSLLEKKMNNCVQIIENIYYSEDIFKPLEFQYHFPRHYNLLQADETFEKLIYIVLTVIQYNSAISCKGSNIFEMRQDMIKQFEIHFNQFLQKGNLRPLCLSDEFLPVTVYSTHRSKADCQSFVDQITKKMKTQSITIEDCQELTLIIDNIVRVRCKWSDPYQTKFIIDQVVQGIIDNPLFIVNQAIIYLQKIRKSIRSDSEQARHYMERDSTLNF